MKTTVSAASEGSEFTAKQWHLLLQNQNSARYIKDRLHFSRYRCENECCPHRGEKPSLRVFWPHHEIPPWEYPFESTQVLCVYCRSQAEWVRMGKKPTRQGPRRLSGILPKPMIQLALDFGEEAA